MQLARATRAQSTWTGMGVVSAADCTRPAIETGDGIPSPDSHAVSNTSLAPLLGAAFRFQRLCSSVPGSHQGSTQRT